MRGVRIAGLLGMALFAAAASGCVDEQIVYRDKPLFEDPPQAAVGFLGYSNAEQKQTTCGNCHNGQQVQWVNSQHANAWNDLQASGHASDACVNCHTVNGQGNSTPAGTKVAYAATKDPRYYDVQCESCHGGGLDHVKDPSATKPLATMTADTAELNGCGGCHTGSHNPFVEEWRSSRHSAVDAHVAARDAASYPSCAICHDGKVFLKSVLKVTNNFVERDDTSKIGQTCVTCHDPHGNQNTAQLRLEANSHTGSTNLCYQCHRRNPTPTGSTSHNEPHSPQGPLTLGETVGWLPPGFPTDKIIGTHGSETNKELCVTCHMASRQLTTSQYTVGHTFNPIPCTNPDGTFATAQDCELSARTFKSCLGGGCHGTEGAARSALIAADGRLKNLSDELFRLVGLAKLTTRGKADYKSDTVVTPIEGLEFNAGLLEGDGSMGAHNPFYIDALLNSSISYIKSYYGVQ